MCVCEERERECKEGDGIEVLGTCSQAESLHLAKPIGSRGLFKQKHCHFGQVPELGSS